MIPKSCERFEEYLLAECRDLLFERFASDTLVRGHSVASDMESRHWPSCVSHKQLRN